MPEMYITRCGGVSKLGGGTKRVHRVSSHIGREASGFHNDPSIEHCQTAQEVTLRQKAFKGCGVRRVPVRGGLITLRPARGGVCRCGARAVKMKRTSWHLHKPPHAEPARRPVLALMIF